MLKMGGVNSPQFHLHTSFVCGQQIDIDTDWTICFQADFKAFFYFSDILVYLDNM